MKTRSTCFGLVAILLATLISAQDVAAQGVNVVGGNNKWVLHTPTTNNNMYIAPISAIPGLATIAS